MKTTIDPQTQPVMETPYSLGHSHSAWELVRRSRRVCLTTHRDEVTSTTMPCPRSRH